MSDSQENRQRRAIVADDEAGMRLALTEVLQRGGWCVEAFENAEEAMARIQGAGPKPELLITDFRMPGMSGLELTRRVKGAMPELAIVMMTAFGTVEDAVTAMKEGADDYLLKPFSMETALAVAENAVRKTMKPEAAPSSNRAARGGESGMVGSDPAWLRVVEIAREVADSDATVLLTGESGTGKEVLARHIHERSGRRGPFVAINCAALPEGVLESELFGHEKGAFTGAVLSRKGRFELAEGGTILLDEVSEMPLALQAKLLRVLQEREVSPIGGTHSIKLDIRVIATTNRDLEAYVAEGNFRQDLFYRLNVIAIHLPALRERREDVMPLAEHFLKKFRRAGRLVSKFSPEVTGYLRTHRWPGNVRELENLVERATLLARGEEIQMGDLHLKNGVGMFAMEPSGSGSWVLRDGILNEFSGRTLEEVERELILGTLDRLGGNRTRTAEKLGVSVRTIRNKLHQYGVKEEAACGA
jgi:DNA-binding NtrC family response regulator